MAFDILSMVCPRGGGAKTIMASTATGEYFIFHVYDSRCLISNSKQRADIRQISSSSSRESWRINTPPVEIEQIKEQNMFLSMSGIVFAGNQSQLHRKTFVFRPL